MKLKRITLLAWLAVNWPRLTWYEKAYYWLKIKLT